MTKVKKPVTAAKTLTFEQRKKALLTPCKTKSELKNWIKYHLSLDLPDKTVSRYADTDPLGSIWEMYSICVNNNNPENVQELLYVAGRGSGKTLAVAIAELLILLHDQRDVAHVGAILSQAKRCYEYQTGFLLNEKLSPILTTKNAAGVAILEKTNMEKSTFNLKDRLTDETIKVTLEILPCTLKSVNGFHGAMVSVDEIDTVSGEGLRAFKDISGMLDSKRGRQALRVGISTRKSRYGLMNQQIESAEQSGRTVRRWTALEFSQRCPDERSGTEPTLGYVKQDTMEVISPETWAQKGQQQQVEFVTNMFPGAGCMKCPMAAVCLGDAKLQDSKSNMLKPISDAIKKTMENGPDWTLSQLFNLKPSVEGIIFKEFDEKMQVKEWNEMWHILTGKDFPGECTHDMFVRKCHEMKLACYAGIDWGWSNPSTVVYFFVDNRENVYVVKCDGMTYLSNPTWINHIKTKYHHQYRCQLYCPDMANPGDAVEMRKVGLPVISDPDKGNINTGIQVIKKWLRTPGMADTKLFFARETCGPIIQEFNMYHFKTNAAGEVTEDPDTEFDHWIDALRYPMTYLFSKSSIILSNAGLDFDKGGITDSQGSFYRTPTPGEFASAMGISVNANQSADSIKIGKVGTLSQLEKDDDEVDGSGSFLWGF